MKLQGRPGIACCGLDTAAFVGAGAANEGTAATVITAMAVAMLKRFMLTLRIAPVTGAGRKVRLLRNGAIALPELQIFAGHP